MVIQTKESLCIDEIYYRLGLREHGPTPSRSLTLVLRERNDVAWKRGNPTRKHRAGNYCRSGRGNESERQGLVASSTTGSDSYFPHDA